MLIYILLLFFVLFLFLIRNSTFYAVYISKRIIFYISVNLLFIIYIFRSSNVGTDYPMYNYFFKVPYDILKLSGLETAYIYINAIAQHYSNFLLVSFLIFFIFFIGMICLVKIFNLNYFTFLTFFVITYIYIYSFDFMRQYSAIGIIGIAISLYIYLYRFKFIKYIIFIFILILASKFHSSAILCIIFLILPKIHLNKIKVIFIGMLTSILFFTNVIRGTFDYLLILFPTYSAKYSDGDFNNTKGIIQLVPVLIQFIFVYIYLKYNKNDNIKTRFIISGNILFLFLYSASGNIIADRFQVYFMIFPLLFSCLFVDSNKISNININNFLKFCYLLFWIIYFLLRLMRNIGGIVPYSFI